MNENNANFNFLLQVYITHRWQTHIGVQNDSSHTSVNIILTHSVYIYIYIYIFDIWIEELYHVNWITMTRKSSPYRTEVMQNQLVMAQV